MSANGTPCSRVDELMARGKISLALVFPILFSFARPASLHYEEHVCMCVCVCTHTHTYLMAWGMYMNYRCYQVTQRL